MFRLITFAALLFGLSSPARASDPAQIVEHHILPGYQTLVAASENLAGSGCDPENVALTKAFHRAFDAWVMVSHIRFGPSETNDRAFSLAFWPDGRGATPKTLLGLLSSGDPVVETPESFATVSIAGRGFYALEFLLFDPKVSQSGTPDDRCALIRAVTLDIALNAGAILSDWQGSYAELLRSAGQNETYRSRDEALRQLLTALSTGLEFTAETRLGRPMGRFDKPRPARAEARRAGRSLRHVVLSLTAMRDLAALLSDQDADLDAAFARAIARAETLDDPVFAGIATPQGRVSVEALQQAIRDIKTRVDQDLGPKLGVAAGFNSLDGD